jgi:hypothetical protein
MHLNAAGRNRPLTWSQYHNEIWSEQIAKYSRPIYQRLPLQRRQMSSSCARRLYCILVTWSSSNHSMSVYRRSMALTLTRDRSHALPLHLENKFISSLAWINTGKCHSTPYSRCMMRSGWDSQTSNARLPHSDQNLRTHPPRAVQLGLENKRLLHGSLQRSV